MTVFVRKRKRERERERERGGEGRWGWGRERPLLIPASLRRNTQILAPFQADMNMKELLAELAAEENAAQLKSSKASRKKKKKKGVPDAPSVSDRCPCLFLLCCSRD